MSVICCYITDYSQTNSSKQHLFSHPVSEAKNPESASLGALGLQCDGSQAVRQGRSHPKVRLGSENPLSQMVHSHGCWQEARVSFLIVRASRHPHDMAAGFPRERDAWRAGAGRGGHSIIGSRIFFETPVESFPSFQCL